MSMLLFIVAFVMFWFGLHLLVRLHVERQVEEEVDRQLAERDRHARRGYRAVHEIRDQLRSTSHEMIATALKEGGRKQTNHSDFEHADRSDR